MQGLQNVCLDPAVHSSLDLHLSEASQYVPGANATMPKISQ
jgi:hypothetical protein